MAGVRAPDVFLERCEVGTSMVTGVCGAGASAHEIYLLDADESTFYVAVKGARWQQVSQRTWSAFADDEPPSCPRPT